MRMDSNVGMFNNHTAVNRTPSTTSQLEVELEESPILDEDYLGEIITRLKEGTLMAQFKKNGKHENKTFYLNLEEFKISWFRSGGGTTKVEEGSIPIEEIKEVQSGCTSKDFTSVIRKLDHTDCCIVIVYGNTFRLKTLSCIAENPKERDFWVKGIVYLKHRNQYVPPVALAHRWLCREWSVLPKNHDKKISMREYRLFLQKANIKISSKKMRETFQSVTKGNHSIDADQFCQAYNKLMNANQVTERYEKFFHKTEGGSIMLPYDFQRFLLEEQKDRKATDIRYVNDIMSHVMSPVDNGEKENTVGDSQNLYFSTTEFLSFLFHPMNSLFNDEHRVVYQDMTKPLSWYWIASSHNTYLTGDQIQSQSSEEAYIRVLRMGCRCVELDCWDGPNNEPIIYHGYTLTTRIKLVDVVKVIANNAFAVSNYPLILSIENHCSIPQQIVIAEIFKRYLGKYLITEPLDPGETQLPSPEALKNKIILKQKRLQTDSEKEAAQLQLIADESILSKCEKAGVLYMKDKFENWNKHLAVLCGNSLFYSSPQDEDVDSDDEEADEKPGKTLGNEDELHFGEKWFHRSIDRVTSELLLKDSQKGDGSFLVRPSTMFVGDYTMSFWWRGKVKHVHIKSRQQQDGTRKYFVVDKRHFDNLYSLITHYQTNSIKSDKLELTLREPVPEFDAHLGKDWYHENLTRPMAEDMLRRMRKDGYFLVRKRLGDFPNELESYAISFRTSGTIKHCRIQKDGRLFMIGSTPFESMTELVEHYEKYPLYRKTKLKYPCNQLVVQEFGQNPDSEEGNPAEFYTTPNSASSKPICRAKYDYEAHLEDELSFSRGALIWNIRKYPGGWWQGDSNGQIQKWFPVIFTEEMDQGCIKKNVISNPLSLKERDNVLDFDNPIDTMQQSNIIDLTGCHPQIIPSLGNRQFMFRLGTKDDGILDCSSLTELDMMEWLSFIQNASEEALCTQKLKKPESEVRNIAKDLSDLVVYCVPVPFSDDVFDKGKYYEMSSLTDLKMERFISRNSYDLRFFNYHEKQITRIYPKFGPGRIDSSNYDPVPFWNFGVQMNAMNYQTTDRYMQIERGTFLDNGGCGYVLQPEIFRDPRFNPFEPSTFHDIEPLNIRLTVIAARHLPKISKGLVSPFVEIDIIGVDCDAANYRTRTRNDNGLCPTWFETFDFDVRCPPLAKIHFVVKNEDMFGDYSFVAQSCFPVTSLREGHRSVPLKNNFSEEIPLSALLVDVTMCNAQEDEEYASISVLRDKMQNLMDMQVAETGNVEEAELQLRTYQNELSRLTNVRESRHREQDLGGKGRNTCE